MQVLETPRLRLRHFAPADSDFILRLVNDPAWLRYIGDRGVRTLDDALSYIDGTLLALCRRVGFGLYCVERKEDGTPVGMCGLVKRESLVDVDLGFAFLPEHRGRGYAFESASAVIEWARTAHGLRRLVAITVANNPDAEKLLTRLGFRFERTVSESDGEALRLFGYSTVS